MSSSKDFVKIHLNAPITQGGEVNVKVSTNGGDRIISLYYMNGNTWTPIANVSSITKNEVFPAQLIIPSTISTNDLYIGSTGSEVGLILYSVELKVYLTPDPIDPIALSSPAGSDNQTVAPGDIIDNIEYTITPSTAIPVVTWNVTPEGITDTSVAGKVTISGAPTTAGTYNYTVKLNDCTLKTGTITVEEVSDITWNGTTNEWNVAANWNSSKQPSKTTNVVIPTGLSVYPLLKETEANKARSITIKGGAEIGRQDLLTYGTATVEYPALDGERWHMLAIPVDDATSQNFYFEDRYTFRRDFTPDGNQAAWKYKQGLEEKFALGQGFAFYAYDALKEEGTSKAFADETISISGQLAGNSIDEPLSFGSDTKYGESPFALAANPFMTTIDFDLLQTANSSTIAKTYLIWTSNAGFLAYNPNGNYGTTPPEELSDGQYIAPLQSFIVQRASATTGDATLSFNLTTISPAANKAILKASAAPVNKLEITASNPAASVLTFIADREGGQPVLSDLDGRKLFSTMNAVPDIYTLKESGNGPVAVGANIIRTDNITVPLGIATTYTGNITLTFKGMDRYDAQIKFIDKQEQPEGIVLTGLESYAYDFSLVEAGVRVEDRFEIQFIPATITGLQTAATGKTLVYSRDNAVRIVSAAGIRSVAVYNLQGQLIYANDSVNDSSFTTSQLPVSGVYLVKVTTGTGVNNVKVTIK
jgi:hypothetical protein